MDVSQIGELIKTTGEVMIGLTVIMVHRRVRKEHRINNKVSSEMAREQIISILGIIFIITGFILKSI